MEQYQVTGMSCAACSARVEKAVSKVPGVESVSVSLLTNSMGVEGTAETQCILKAVEDAGYHAEPKNSSAEEGSQVSGGRAAGSAEALEDHDTPKLRARLIASVVFLSILMYISMGNMMWGWYLPTVLAGTHTALVLVQL